MKQFQELTYGLRCPKLSKFLAVFIIKFYIGLLPTIVYFNTLNKVQKILRFLGMSENSDQSFNMVVYEKFFFFRFLKFPEVTISCRFKY